MSGSVDDERPTDDRDSGMSIEVTLSVGYRRKRPDTKGDRIEARLDSAGLLLVGAAIVLITLILIMPKIFAWLGSL